MDELSLDNNATICVSKHLSNGYYAHLMRTTNGAVSMVLTHKSIGVSMVSVGIAKDTNETYIYSEVKHRQYIASVLAGWQWARSKRWVSRSNYVLGRRLILMHVCRDRIREHRHVLTHDSAVLLAELMRNGG